MTIRLTPALSAIACAVLSVCSLASAQEDSPGQASPWLRVDVVQVLPDELDEFLELRIERVNPALKDAGVPWRSAWLTAEFGNTYERVFATPLRSLAEYDAGGPLSRSLEADRLTQLRDRIRRCLAGRQSYGVRYAPELSIEASDVRQLTLARMATIQITPGRATEWRAFVREQMPGLRDAGTVLGVYERMFGPGPASSSRPKIELCEA